MPAALLELRWSKPDLEPVFGPLSGRKSWHRLEERVSKLNKDGRRLGVRLSAAFEDGLVVLSARDADALAAFRAKLDRAPGRVQRAFGQMIRARTADGGPAALARCLDLQRGEVVRSAREPLRLFSELAALSGTVFIDPPYRLDAGAAKPRGAAAAVLDWTASPGAGTLLVVGPSGIGKSTLAGEVFRRLAHAPSASWSHPLFVPASEVSFDAAGTVQWERLPGVPAGLGARLDGLFREGRLLLFLDGLDENVRLMDLGDPAAWAFWGLASRNRCVVTCRDRFYHLRFACSPVERIFGGGLRVLHLPYWGPGEAKALYAAISESARGAANGRPLVEGLGHLSRLESKILQRKMAAFQITGLTAWNFAIYFALHNGGKFARTEYEILDFFVNQALRWEKRKARDAEPLPVEVLRGLLVRLGRIADGERNGRKTWRVTPEAIVEVAGRFYPFLLERKEDLFRALRQIPFLEYEAETGAFHLDYALGCFFTAKNIVAMGLQGDDERLREEFQNSISFQTFVFLLQSFEGLNDDEKGRFFDTGRRLFEEAARLHSLDRDERHLQSMYEILEPLGNLRWAPADRFLRELASRPRAYPELVNLAAARAIAYGGDAAGVDAYIKRLKREPAAREFNRDYYRRVIWRSVSGDRRRGGDSRAMTPEEWQRLCRWFVRSLSGTHYKALRHIHVFTFHDLLKAHEKSDLRPGALRELLGRLRRESPAWSGAARADLKDLERLALKLDPGPRAL